MAAKPSNNKRNRRISKVQTTASLSERLDAIVTSVIRKACIAMFSVIALLMVVNVFNRFFPVLNVSWFDEIVEGLFAWLVFLGSAELWRENEHFTVTFLPDWLRGRKGELLGFA
jgi:TRAP-type C4-dicarboxylate transport system permease small subunit